MAAGFELWLSKRSTCFLLMAFEGIFNDTDALFSILQSKTMDIGFCCNRIKDTMKVLDSKRQDFDRFHAHFEERCDEMELVHHETQDGLSKKTERARIYYCILDNVNVQMKTRFVDNFSDLDFIGLVDCNKFEEMLRQFEDSKLEKLSKYASHIGGADWGFFDACGVKINEIKSGPEDITPDIAIQPLLQVFSGLHQHVSLQCWSCVVLPHMDLTEGGSASQAGLGSPLWANSTENTCGFCFVLTALGEEGEVEKELQGLREKLSSLEGVIQRSEPPNLKALEKMREIRDSFKTVVDAFEESTNMARRRNHEFEQVKANRFRLFSQCFEHVCVAIDQIYKQMCRNTSAQAILSAENPDEPYLDGISYNCVAPGKRFMAMDNLSGGEKAIAALALVFAIHSFRPAPFFVLDEVDAALDNTNIGKVTGFIREQCRENFQVIVISLKEEFYSRADVLLGVYSESGDTISSRVLSIDLTPYPLTEDTLSQRDKEM
ncbi:uncharacterized protein LOC116222760 [Clupea harengus]|uniref:Uncharacterized protein LOC116222760 n=1 Tax=Clupea harengus TaxID=7950 RepID=A0A8M1KAD5_CLUHA|nr:uncharacterized protein LOC116222760 [Clupea harengus]